MHVLWQHVGLPSHGQTGYADDLNLLRLKTASPLDDKLNRLIRSHQPTHRHGATIKNRWLAQTKYDDIHHKQAAYILS